MPPAIQTLKSFHFLEGFTPFFAFVGLADCQLIEHLDTDIESLSEEMSMVSSRL